jgi:hypothetical protein
MLSATSQLLQVVPLFSEVCPVYFCFNVPFTAVNKLITNTVDVATIFGAKLLYHYSVYTELRTGCVMTFH